jgi:Tfp pilus tip-associated adhesin PilY1
MKNNTLRHSFLAHLLALPLIALPLAASGALTDLSQTPISGASSMEIKPNILFIMDDSYSMDWTYLPDWAGEIAYSSTDKWRPSNYQKFNAGFNGVAYDPAITYSPPSYFNNDGADDIDTFPSQTGAVTGATTTGAWTKVPVDGYGVQSAAIANLIGGAFYYRTVAGEFCTNESLRDCHDQDAATAGYPVAATLRWCNTAADAALPNDNNPRPACQAVYIDTTGASGGDSLTYMYPRMPAPLAGKLSISGSGSSTVHNIKVNGQEILSGPTDQKSTPADLAAEIVVKIRNCLNQRTGGCARAGYDAKVSAAPNQHQVLIYAPGDIANTVLPVVTVSGMTVTSYPFDRLDPNVAGYVEFVPITSTTTSYPKAASRNDCTTGADYCTYTEEMTNYANWYAYYRTRMQAMKTAASRSFQPISDLYRIGYFSINNNTGTDFQNIADFGGVNKKNWYDKLFAASSLNEDADTPLRYALSQAGHLFAGLYNGQSLNGVAVVDPMQYYCQPNVAILSTDGYWNKAEGFVLNGAPGSIGDQDGPDSGEPRPILDNGAGLRKMLTEKWFKTIEPTVATWFQKKEDEWLVDRYGFDKQTQTVDQHQENTLMREDHLWTKTTYVLQKNVYTHYHNYWHDISQGVTQWKREVQLVYRYLYRQEKQIVQKQKRTNGKVTYQDRLLYTYKKALSRKEERDLYRNVRHVYKQVETNGSYPGVWTLVNDGDVCVNNSNTMCKIDDFSENAWEGPVSSCTPGGTGMTPGSLGGDNIFDRYQAVTQCQYRGSAASEAAATTETVSSSSCTEEGTAGYAVPHQVKCTSLGVGADTLATTCTVTAEDGCKYGGYGASQLWTQPSACLNNSGGGSAIGAVWTSPGRACTPWQFTDWVPVNSNICVESDDAYGVHTSCGDNGLGWTVATEECQQTDFDATGNKVECRLTNYSNGYADSSGGTAAICTPSTSGLTQTSCAYVYTLPTTYPTSCTPTAYGADGDGNWHNYVKCTPYAYSAVGNCDPNIDVNQCLYEREWDGWSGFSTTTACTSIKQSGNWNVPVLGDTQCQYVLVTPIPPASTTSCEADRTNPETPTTALGLNNPAAFGHNVVAPKPQYVKCVDSWRTPQTATSCLNNGTTSRCSYSTGISSPGLCPTGEILPSSGNGTWTTATTCTNSKGFSAVVWVPYGECTSSANTLCATHNLYNQHIADAYPALDFDPQTTPLSDSTRLFHLEPIKPFYSIIGAAESTQKPKATLEDMSPSNPGFCPEGEGVTYGLKADGVTEDKTKVITCQKVVPDKSGAYAVAACPGTDPATNTTSGALASADTEWANILCTVTKGGSGNNSEPDCGKQPDGTFLNDIPATLENQYTHTICTQGEGTPSPNTLADVAEYYFKTDLRTPALNVNNCLGAPIALSGGGTTSENVCNNSGRAKDGQVMSTYTLGLGASGVMQFKEGYGTADSGDFYSVWQGVMADPDNGICSWQLSGSECNWPEPATNSQANIDDLWHAAVNGRGVYFSAKNPQSMAAGISAALQSVIAKEGSLASVTISGPRLEADGTTSAFQVSFTAGPWTGEVVQYAITPDMGLDQGWSAQTAIPFGERKIFFFDTNGDLETFQWSKVNQSYFTKPHIAGLSQLCTAGTTCLPNTDPGQADPAFGEKLVNFLRGDRSNEGDVSNFSKYFRERTSVLGDIVGSQAVYVKKPTKSYTDNGYSTFRDVTTASRAGMVYVGANDGMLHAFDASNGKEAWAVVPSLVMDQLFWLADKGYSQKHRFFVDGTPVVGDICVSNCAPGSGTAVWKTILVGGLNLGGKGYYALDITKPEEPKGLWEFSDGNKLGYSYGNPVITKTSDGKWVVLVTSGYNNVTGGGDGQGRLYVLDAENGNLIRSISTGVGDTTTPSGLAKIATWVNYPEYNNASLRVYGGDLEGNVWRFDINDSIGPSGYEAQRLATLRDAFGNVQPITAPPELGTIKNMPVVFVGTGQLLGAQDMSLCPEDDPLCTKGTQSMYAMRDRLTADDYGDPRIQGSFVRQEMTSATCPNDNPYCTPGENIVTVTDLAVDWMSQSGWYVDFPVRGERVNTAMRLMQGTLAFTTNTPQTGACVPAGVSFQYFLDYRTGSYIDGTDGMAGYQLGDDLASAGTYLQSDDGSVRGLVEKDSGGKDGISIVIPPFESPATKVRRISWRELSVEKE